MAVSLIDAAGLSDSAVPAKVFARALRLEGFLITEESRSLVMKALRREGAEAGTTVYTGLAGVGYWAGAPREVKVKVVPGDEEVSQDDRLTDTLAWMLVQSGVSVADARTLFEKMPTSKHRYFGLYGDAILASKDFDGLVPDVGFEALVSELEYLGDTRPVRERPYSVTLVTDAGAYSRLADRLEQAVRLDEVIGLDVETDEEKNYEAKLVGVGFAFGAGGIQVGRESSQTGLVGGPNVGGQGTSDRQPDLQGPATFYLPLNGPLGEEPALSLLRLYFWERTCPRYIAHNGKYDSECLAKAVHPADPLVALRKMMTRLAGDGLIAAFCLGRVDPFTGRPLPRDLKTLTFQHYGVQSLTFKDMLALSGAERSSQAPITDIGPYCCADSYWGVKVLEAILRELERYPSLRRLYDQLELPTVPLIAEMELLGLPIDRPLLLKRKGEFEKRVEVYRKYLENQAVSAGYKLKVEKKMCSLHSRKKVDYEPCGHCDDRGRVEVTVPFNPGSRPQVEAVLQGSFGLPRMGSTPGGDASNDEPALLRLREFSSNEDAKDWITFLLAWRKDDKIRGTYLEGIEVRLRRDGWQEGLGVGEWFVHPKFNQATTGEEGKGQTPASGRLSSKDPNGQNIPYDQRDLFAVTV